MKIAICIGQSSMGGVGTSTFLMASGMRDAGHQADIIVTSFRPGPGYERARGRGWPIEAICVGDYWLRKRLKKVLNCLSTYEVVINNHSLETKLILPALPADTIRISVIRSTNAEVITEAETYGSFVDSFVGISPEVLRLLNLASIQARIDCIPNAVVVNSSELPSLSSTLRLVYLGRLSNIDKNIMLLPDILKECKSLIPDITLDIVGDGKDRQELQHKINEMGLAECISLVGEINREEVGQYLSKRQFALFPSNYEGFGLSLAESMAVGCLPIAADIPSYRWILGENSNSLTCPVNDANAYAERILSLATNPECYKRIQKQLRLRQTACFSVPIMTKGYLSLIENLNQEKGLDKHKSLPLKEVPLSSHHRFQFSRRWWFLRKVKNMLDKVKIVVQCLLRPSVASSLF